MYKISARQILMIALISGIFAAGAVVILDRIKQSPSAVVRRRSAKHRRRASPIPATSTDEQNNIEVYRTLSPGVVFIHSTSYARDFLRFVEPQEGSGSGSILDQQGNILTNYHVIEARRNFQSAWAERKIYPAVVVGGDPDTDLAVIRLTEKPAGQLTVVPMGDSDRLVSARKCSRWKSVRFGLYADNRVSSADYSDPLRARNNRLIEGAIQTDASINPGNSGGPLLDSHGRMIGINSQILSPVR
jgi:putative serine protease PepD